MSDYYVDSDDDDEEMQPTSTYRGKRNKRLINAKTLKDKNKRENHNLDEKQRRNLIKKGFENLHAAVPRIQNQKASRKDVLQETITYIKEGQLHLKMEQAEIDALNRQNNILENQIKILENEIARKSGDMVLKTVKDERESDYFL